MPKGRAADWLLWSCIMVSAATLAVGAWASYSAAAAAPRAVAIGGSLALLVGAVALGRRRGAAASNLRNPGGLLSLLASVAAAAIAIAWFALPGRIHPNLAAGALVVLLPVTFSGIVAAARSRALAPLAVHTALALPALACLVASSSRGERGRQAPVAAAITAALIALPAATLVFSIARPDLAAVVGGIGSDDVGRLPLWGDMLSQLADVPFTGSGLGATMMNDATYVRLTHVGFIQHAHQLYLQVALEQGIPGLVAFLGIQALALYLAIRAGALVGVASLTAMLAHGAVDAELYAARYVSLIFFPAAIALFLAGASAEALEPESARPWPLLAAVPLLALLLLPTVRAALQADVGAVLQARAELSVYTWPVVPIQDALRRDPAIDLAPAIARFRAALALDPANATAHRRLGQIELARGDYRGAEDHFQAALQREQLAAWGGRAARQLLGELYAIAGDASGAKRLWQGLDVGQGQLSARRYWYESIGEPAKAAAILAAEEALRHAE
ncbi:MAG: O-antigen ligase family protein [Anaerolineae bacterium]|nr:O-antigen ligase family protein [Anaerolineae bacterium]